MLMLRWVVLLLLVASAICFALFAGTREARYKTLGLVILKWTLLAAAGFFAVLIAQNILSS